MQFNKLYNLILESIITEDINSKIKKAINTLIKSGLLKGEDDPRALQVKTIIKRNANIDINGKTKLDLLIKANLKYINRNKNNNIKQNIIEYIDNNVSLFTHKKLYKYNVIVYNVEDSKKGHDAVRKIVDICWGEDANPWCLISRNVDDLDDPDYTSSYDYWKLYSAWPKQIAFQDGKLLAFRAGKTTARDPWWDRKDEDSDKLVLLDNETFISIPKPKRLLGNQKVIINRMKNKCTYNLKTGRWDASYIKLFDDDLIKGAIPIPLGVVEFFDVYDCNYLKDFTNAPTEVTVSLAYNKWNRRVAHIIENSDVYKKYKKQEDAKKSEELIEKYNLKYNLQTKKYDFEANGFEKTIYLSDYLVDGAIPIPLGVINGNISLLSKELKSLKNFPTVINGYLFGEENVKDLLKDSNVIINKKSYY